ncbi:MAG: hypothetical protein IPP72_15105 [Chitinophagaceae bacterium]|nr:hypothetical protein [Chitinophagaceae bacterium]
MKRILSLIVMIICSYFSNAQENNPFNQLGIDYVTSLKIITEDFKAGKIKDFSKEAIEAYSHKLPIKGEVNMDLAGKIFSTIKANDFDFVKLVKESSFSETSKEFFIAVSVNPGKLDLKQMNEYLINKTDEIKKSEVGDSEKEMVLSLISIAYRVNGVPGDNNDSNCFMSGPVGSGPINCVIAGVIGGGIIGWSICGLPCTIGGAIIGGILGAVS